MSWSSRSVPACRGGAAALLLALCLLPAGAWAGPADAANATAANATAAGGAESPARPGAGREGDPAAACPAPDDPTGDLRLPERARNPFSAIRPGLGAAAQDVSSVTVRFDGSDQAPALPLNLANMPRIRVVGLLDNGQSISVLADLEKRGRVILRAKEQVFISDDRKSSDALWFTVQEITHNSMTLLLKDGVVVHGNFF